MAQENEKQMFTYPEMDFATEVAYFSNGTPAADGQGAIAFQGLTLTEYRRFTKSGKWAFMGYTPAGEPNLGYLPEELTKARYELWESRIKGAMANPVDGYTDTGGTWFPGNLPNSVLNAVANEARKEMLERSYYNHVAPQILELEMLETEKHVRLKNFKTSMGMAAKESRAKQQDNTPVLAGITAMEDGDMPTKDKKQKFAAALAALKAMQS